MVTTDGKTMKILKPFTENRVEHILFDFDGTIARTREGWEWVMGNYMVEVLTSCGAHDAVIEKVNKYISESSGIQTIYQMEWLAREVGVYCEALDALEYKKEYVSRMVILSESRIRRVESGEIEREELMVSGVIDFLERAYSIGMKLYIASGTDQEYVRRDVKALGIEHYFKGVYGAGIVGYSKRKVIEEIMIANHLDGSQLAVIGDGHVEIEEAVRVNAIGIGIGDDKLVEANASILMKDFSEWRELIELISWKYAKYA